MGLGPYALVGLVVAMRLLAGISLVGAGLVLGIVISDGRVSRAKNETLEVIAAWDKYRADRIEAGLKQVEWNITLERNHSADTQENVDEYQMSESVRIALHRADLAVADRLRIEADQRAARYRAQAQAGAAACSDLADRHAALDQHIIRGADVVARLRDDLARRDGEVKLLLQQVMIDRALCDPAEILDPWPAS